MANRVVIGVCLLSFYIFSNNGWMSPTSRPRIILADEGEKIRLECHRPPGLTMGFLGWTTRPCLYSYGAMTEITNATSAILSFYVHNDTLGRYACILKGPCLPRTVVVERVWVLKRVEISLTPSGIHCRSLFPVQNILFMVNGDWRRSAAPGEQGYSIFPVDFKLPGRYVYTCAVRIGACYSVSKEVVLMATDLSPTMVYHPPAKVAEGAVCVDRNITDISSGSKASFHLYSCDASLSVESSIFFERDRVCGRTPSGVRWTYFLFQVPTGRTHIIRHLPSVFEVRVNVSVIGCKLSSNVSVGAMALVSSTSRHVYCELRFDSQGNTVITHGDDWWADGVIDQNDGLPILLCRHTLMWSETLCVYVAGNSGLGSCASITPVSSSKSSSAIDAVDLRSGNIVVFCEHRWIGFVLGAIGILAIIFAFWRRRHHRDSVGEDIKAVV